MMNEERCSRENAGCTNLPPSFSKRNNNSRLHNNPVTIKKRSNDKQPILTTCLSSSSSYSSLSTLPFKTINNKGNSSNKKCVVFNELVKVVLIPSRQEYKLRGLELMLWWNPNDYFQFQQEARSEITLCATFENISFTQARSKLYQPDPKEMDPYNSKLTMSQSISQMSLQAIDDDDYYSASVESSPINTQYSLHNRNSNDLSDNSNNSTDNDTSDDSDEDNQDNNIMSGRIRFYQHSPKPSQASLILVNNGSNKFTSSSPAACSKLFSKRMSVNDLDTFREDDDDDNDDKKNSCITAHNVNNNDTNDEIIVNNTTTITHHSTPTTYNINKSISCPAHLSAISSATSRTQSPTLMKSHGTPSQQQLAQQQQPIDDLHICVLSSEFQCLTSSSSYPDTYLERLRKRNLESFTGMNITINTPSLTVCSVFALTVVAVVARFF